MPITIDKGSKYFDTKLYTGTGSSQSIGSLNFSPDFVWIKNRSGANSHGLVTSLVDTRYALDTSATSAEVDFSTSGVTSLNSDGFTVVSHAVFNGSSNNYVSWNWRGSDSSAVSNNSGSITSTVSANTTSGFSIVSYTGTGADATVGHGLGATPAMIIVKSRNAVNAWYVVHNKSWGNDGNGLFLSNTANIYNRVTDLGGTGITAWSSSTFSMTNGSGTFLCTNGTTYIAYCFAEVKGFSKFGSYTGNGSTDGTFVYTGFKPAFVIIKRTDTSGNSWMIIDNKRNSYNVMGKGLFPDDSGAEYDYTTVCDFLSNGFKMRDSGGGRNASGGTYIYMAFAENPFVSSKGVAVTAR